MDGLYFGTIVYGMCSMVTYALVTFVILKHSYKFQKSFFKLFVVGFVMNTICYANSYLTMRIPQHTEPNGTFYDFYASLTINNTETSFPLNLFHTLHFEFAYTQYIFNFLICLNRFTAVYAPHRDEKFWTLFLWPIVIAMFVLPFIYSTRHIFFNHSFFAWNPITSRFSVDSYYPKSSIYDCLTPFLVFVTIVNILLNFATWKRIKDMKKKDPTVKIRGSSLFYVSFAGFCIEIFLASLTVLAYYLSHYADMTTTLSWTLQKTCSYLMPFASDALTLTQPFLVLFYSKKTKNVFYQEFKCLRRFQKAKIVEESKTEAGISETNMGNC